MAKIAFAQPNINHLLADSLKNELSKAKHDTVRVRIYGELAIVSGMPGQEKIDWGLKGYELSKKIRFEKGQINCGLRAKFLGEGTTFVVKLPIKLT